MITATKKRINISLSRKLDGLLNYLAERDEVPQATKAAQLIQIALELEEDDILNQLAAQRDRKKVKFLSHQKAWA